MHREEDGQEGERERDRGKEVTHVSWFGFKLPVGMSNS